MTTDGRRKGALSEINVTPLVDVVLVLLIIFMVTTPMMKQGIEVELPKAEPKRDLTGERLVVTVARSGQIYLNDQGLTPEQLEEQLRSLSQQDPSVAVFIRADRLVPYESVVQALDRVKRAGVYRVGMVTEPLSKEY
jgi:biopolymer transport protein TolR